MDLFNYQRRTSSEVNIGAAPMGSPHPIRIQSMTNTSTLDTEASAAQAQRIAEAGGEYVRLTTQGVREAENLRHINGALRRQQVMVPLVADVHFNPKVAEVAALYAEKVRINPGNYVDPVRTFKEMTYTDEEYAQEVEKIRERFIPFLEICKANRTAIRIGVNHGSLSDRIMSRYGDTPEGIVESCMEFLRICVAQGFTDVVVSIKASNTVVMVRAVRLLAQVMEQEGMSFPLHLGVTEAGDGEDGRIKSALGIGALLADGLGDTIRVSLSEEPEVEIPVARRIVDYIGERADHPFIYGEVAEEFNYLAPERRKTQAVRNIGGGQPPVVIAERMNGSLEYDANFKPDYIYCGRTLHEHRIPDTDYIVDIEKWAGQPGTFPVFKYNQVKLIDQFPEGLKFLFMPLQGFTEEVADVLRRNPDVVLISQSSHPNRLGEQRALAHLLMKGELANPVVYFQLYREEDVELFQLKAAIDMGALLFDGLCDGIFLINMGKISHEAQDATAFNILQGTRTRISKTEYISCPGCGRTLFSLQPTIARVKAATSHLKGLKIGIMGCIVNGPGEMADADYGYVGAGRGKISLYKQKECVARNIPEEEAVERLIELMKEHGDYREVEE